MNSICVIFLSPIVDTNNYFVCTFFCHATNEQPGNRYAGKHNGVLIRACSVRFVRTKPAVWPHYRARLGAHKGAT